MSGIGTLFKENKIFRRILRGVLVLLYSVLFTILCFTENPFMVAQNVNDHMSQQGIDRSPEIVVVAIRPEDEAHYGKSAAQLCAEAIRTMNRKGEPAVIGIEVSDPTMSEEEFFMLAEEASKDNLVFPVELAVPENAMIQAPFTSELPKYSSVRCYPETVTQGSSEAHTVRLSDSDGVLRHMTFDLEGAEGGSYSSMAWVCYEKYCEANGKKAVKPKGADQNSVIICFSEQDSDYILTATDILSGTANAEIWQDKIVFIGSYDSTLDQVYRTAIRHDSYMHSAQADAEITNALLSGRTAFSVPVRYQMIVLFLCALLTVFVLSKIHTIAGDICYCLLYELSAAVISMLLFGVGYGWLVFPHLANGFVTCVLFIGIIGLHRSHHNRRQLENMLGKYVDMRIAGGLINRESEVNMPMSGVNDGSTAKVAVLFADIRGFTTISENMAGDRLVRMLNNYLSMMSECVERYGGTVDKFIGDCVMAYWGAPEADEDSVYHACLAAAEIQRRAREASNRMRDRLGQDISIGIGISYGDAVVGNIGSANRMNYTVIGDTVNVASRLESIAPGGETYLSGEAVANLKEAGEMEKLPDEVKLKGRQTQLSVYSMKSISVRGSLNRKKKEEQKGKNAFRRRGYVAAVVNFLIFFLQFIFVINTIRSYGIGFISYFTVVLSALSCVVSVLLIPYDLRAAEQADGENVRPHWLDVAMVAALMANMQNAIAVLFWKVPELGLAAYTPAGWPGGATIYLVCPLLAEFSFFVLEQRARYLRRDIFFAEMIPATLLLCSSAIASAVGLNRKAPELYGVFYDTPIIFITILLQIAGISVIVLTNRKLRLQERIVIRREIRPGDVLKRLRRSKPVAFFRTERSRLLLRLALNLFIGGMAFRVTKTAVMAGGIHAYSNPSLTGIVIMITSAMMIILILASYVRHEPTNRNWVYKYVSFIRNLGCSVNFFSVFLLAVSGEGITALFEPRWSADGWFFVVVPLLSMLSWLSERNEYTLRKLLLAPVPYAILLPISRAAIIGRGWEELYAYEIENYYGASAIIAMIAAEFLLVGLMYLVNLMCCRAFRESERDEGESIFSVCGCRYGITAGTKTESAFGLRSECYVLREGSYGIVIGAGSGLSSAPEKLKGCTNVDILVGSVDFRCLMGFLMTPSVCPGADIRILTPFGAERFSVNPFWPVNLIRKNCVTVPAGKPYRLNDTYSVLFTSSDSSGSEYMIRVSGDVTVCYTGQKPAPEASMRKWCLGADLLIYSAGDTWERGCYVTIDNGIPALLLSGAPIELSDDLLSWKEQKAGALYAEVYIAKEGLTFPLRR